ncbi:MAG: hypothetical protein ABTR54_09745 [Candidatus Competibacter sp.]
MADDRGHKKLLLSCSFMDHHTLLPCGGKDWRRNTQHELAWPARRDDCNVKNNRQARFANLVAIFASQNANMVAIFAMPTKIGA